jgi:hypothetical protein
MTPFIPPPPICAARPLHAAGKTTRKLIGREVLLASTGAIDPSTRQNAGSPFAASTQVADDSATLRTGSPIADAAIDVPTLVEVQSDAVIATSVRPDETGV